MSLIMTNHGILVTMEATSRRRNPNTAALTMRETHGEDDSVRYKACFSFPIEQASFFDMNSLFRFNRFLQILEVDMV